MHRVRECTQFCFRVINGGTGGWSEHLHEENHPNTGTDKSLLYRLCIV